MVVVQGGEDVRNEGWVARVKLASGRGGRRQVEGSGESDRLGVACKPRRDTHAGAGSRALQWVRGGSGSAVRWLLRSRTRETGRLIDGSDAGSGRRGGPRVLVEACRAIPSGRQQYRPGVVLSEANGFRRSAPRPEPSAPSGPVSLRSTNTTGYQQRARPLDWLRCR